MTINLPVWFPNALSASRLGLAPVLIALAWLGYQQTFLLVLVAAFATDALDGIIARRFQLESEFGAQLDSWGDVAIYLSLTVSAHLLWPEIMRGERFYVALAMVSIAMPAVAGMLKFSTLPNYHTWLMKLTAVLLVPGCLILFIGGPNWLFRVACVFCFLSAVENVLITAHLKKPLTNVKTLWHVLRLNNAD